MRFLARGFNEQGNAASRAGNPAEAERLWRQAVTVDPQFSAAWFNLGLLAKQRGNWSECYQCNRRAVNADPKNTGAWWNFGIAATALRRWTEARQAWAAHKIPVPSGTGEIRMEFGLVPVRLTSQQGEVEVIWGEMIDPARVQLQNVPRAESGYRFGDIVLRDGAPDGERELEGRKIPIFNVLGLWQASELGTFEVELSVGDEARAALEAGLSERGWGRDDWSTIRKSGGAEAEVVVPPADGGLRWAIASASEEALREWLGTQASVQVHAIRVAVPPGPR